MPEPLASLYLRIPYRLKELLEQLATRTGESQNQIAVAALEAYLRGGKEEETK